MIKKITVDTTFNFGFENFQRDVLRYYKKASFEYSKHVAVKNFSSSQLHIKLFNLVSNKNLPRGHEIVECPQSTM